jgi:hypothetical protein
MTSEAQLVSYLERAKDPETAGSSLRSVVDSYKPPGSGGPVDDHRVRSTQSVSRPKDWEVSLVSEVGRAFGCTVLWESGRSQDEDYWGKYHIVGQREAVHIAEASVVALFKTLARVRLSERQRLSASGLTRGPEMTAELDRLCCEFVDRTLAYLPNPIRVDVRTSKAVRELVVEITGRSSQVTGVVRTRRANFEIRRPRARRRGNR